MTESGPSILVLDSDRDERMLIASVLREAGFAVIAAADDCGASAAMSRQRFAAAVIALPEGEEIELLRQVRRRQPDLKALVVVDPAALRLVDEGCGTVVKRPFDPRQLLGCVFELVLRENASAPPHPHAAELGITAAKLACLQNRRTAAAAAGAGRLAQDLTRQIGEATATHRGLAAAITFGGHAATGSWGVTGPD
jgi:DNA-binding response OmpR family regulator